MYAVVAALLELDSDELVGDSDEGLVEDVLGSGVGAADVLDEVDVPGVTVSEESLPPQAASPRQSVLMVATASNGRVGRWWIKAIAQSLVSLRRAQT
ncbi:hypothetical protein GCM10011492_02070 [Flexivirga endophytica]|uniref:Uncharacterized protein n=1 Tax=Flexivirga endophytica TaxID=1849103 RepID=A0A916WNQ0_9MICO|nr:hypothetical protein GCM10011492_02070 [Flexivirga endophytica]GHB39652.1 hypothetical protein GCM10008112_05540 [Flexivirga endophytica]